MLLRPGKRLRYLTTRAVAPIGAVTSKRTFFFGARLRTDVPLFGRGDESLFVDDVELVGPGVDQAASPDSAWRPLGTMPHDDVYLLDSSLVLGYCNDEIPGWKAFVNDHVQMGKRFYLLPQAAAIASEHAVELPGGFVRAKLDDGAHEMSQVERDAVREEVIRTLDIQGTRRARFRVSIDLLVEACHFVAAADPSQLSADDVHYNRVVFASSNLASIKRLVGCRAKADLVQRALSKHALGTMTRVRHVSARQSWNDFCRLPSVIYPRCY
ncbi:PIN domain-containing protein [Plasmodiophora brassicae]